MIARFFGRRLVALFLLIFLFYLLHHELHPHRDNIVMVTLVTASPRPHRDRIMSMPIVSFPADRALLPGIRSLSFLHNHPSYNENMALTFFTVLSLTSASLAVWRIG